MPSKVTSNTKPFRELVNLVKKLDGQRVKVGWFEGELALIAMWMEFGTRTIPARPALRITMALRRDDIIAFQGRLAALFLAGKINEAKMMSLLGEYMVSLVKETIVKYGKTVFVPLAASTLARKAPKTTPLIDTGQLINALTYVVVE